MIETSTAEVWRCTVCKYVWFKTAGKIAVRCPSPKCRKLTTWAGKVAQHATRRWNGKADSPVATRAGADPNQSSACLHLHKRAPKARLLLIVREQGQDPKTGPPESNPGPRRRRARSPKNNWEFEN